MNPINLEGQPSLYLEKASRYCGSDERTVRTGRRNHCGPDRSELTTAGVRDRIGKIRVVEHVVRIRAQTEAHTFRDRNILQDRQIGVEVVGTTEGVPRNVAEVGFGPNAGELRGLQALSRIRTRPWIEAARRRPAQEVGQDRETAGVCQSLRPLRAGPLLSNTV